MRIIEDIFKEIPKHRKNKSPKFTSFEKTKYKHEYTDCLLIYKGESHKSEYCKICGKINNIIIDESERIEKNGKTFYRLLKDDEIFDKYKDLERIKVDNIWNRYVPINKGE